MLLNQLTNQGKTNTQPVALMADMLGTGLFEQVEDILQVRRRKPHAVVDDINMGMIFHFAQDDAYLGGLAAELQGVLQQVPDHLFEPGRASFDD
ncbi:hypothetical protein D3C76_1217170 [compost metagenome]